MSTALSASNHSLSLTTTPITTDLSPAQPRLLGFIIASLIMAMWAGSLTALLRTAPNQLHPLWTVPAILWQMFLYTGLFVTAHDAMHGVVVPQHPKLNRFVGWLALVLYGFFSYKQLFKAHWQHHHHPASPLDPDYHNGTLKNPVAWYIQFLQRYWSWPRLLALVAAFHTTHLLLHVPEANLLLFWVVPSLLSSVHLFYFGTYLPHREPAGGYQNAFRAQSAHRPLLLSLLACYHFGYHCEHHEYPHVPWWQLPTIAKRSRPNLIPS
ncbi:MAG: fatty acid desaturase [Stenomitos rutilans HA7619-LM2]|jgi:beta-carotene ketolase (CrtW type)|nr:fatty acid desaturase [Stenomitos rutilans HA7619-LM2]